MSGVRGKRLDAQGHVLRKGEYYNGKTGRYRCFFKDEAGKLRQLYSWTLTPRQRVPAGKRQQAGMSLREKEARLRRGRSGTPGGSAEAERGELTLLQLMGRYLALRDGAVRESTRSGYRAQWRFVKKQAFAQRKIGTISPFEAERWFLELHNKYGRGYSLLCALRGILRPAYRLAMRNGWAERNPFDFPMSGQRYGGRRTTEALTARQMTNFLTFLRDTPRFRGYFNGAYILFHTGLRISEFCGLCIDDIDFAGHVIHVRRQLFRAPRAGRASCPEGDAQEGESFGEGSSPRSEGGTAGEGRKGSRGVGSSSRRSSEAAIGGRGRKGRCGGSSSRGGAAYTVELPKTVSGQRDVPMTEDVEAVFREVIAQRATAKGEVLVWDKKRGEARGGFLWLNREQRPELKHNWVAHLRNASLSYNRSHPEAPIPLVTPHVCRHSFCTACARSGKFPKALQRIMGHASIETTMDVYVHGNIEEIKEEFFRVAREHPERFLQREEA